MDAPSSQASEKSAAVNPYAAPGEPSALPWEPSEWKRARTRSLLFLGAAVALWGFVFAFLFTGTMRPATEFFFVISALLALASSAFAFRTLQLARRSPSHVSRGFVVLAAIGGVGGLFMTALGFCSAILASSSFSRGRQLRRRGKILLAPIERNEAWASEKMKLGVPDEDREDLARAWRENGRTEHASVAAFARLTLDLMALGAPPELVASANRDALDEIRHTELCFSLARALDEKSESPAAFPEAQKARTLSSNRTIALAELAIDSLIDGALHEGVSARVVAKLVRKCESPKIRAILREIAADEGRHAAHGWDVVEWCLAEGGPSIARALFGATRALPIALRAALPRQAEEGDWERYGIMGRALEATEYEKARADLVRRVEASVADYFKPAANSSTTQTVPSESAIAATPR